jgi:hypothetical protein
MPIRDNKSPRYKTLERLGRRGQIQDTITTGIHGQEGGEEHPGGISVAEIGSIHEFGLGVPERSFVRVWFDENKSRLPEAIRVELETAIAQGNPRLAIERLAITIQASIQQRISNGIDPELAESTILQKGSSTPLIDTGVLRSSIMTRSTSGAEAK